MINEIIIRGYFELENLCVGMGVLRHEKHLDVSFSRIFLEIIFIFF